jgi:hypothetical protein
MTRIAVPLSILAVAALAACSSYSGSAPEAHAAPVVPQTMSYQPGMGVVDNVVVAPSPMSSSRGGTATGASSHPAGTSATDRPEPRVGTPSSSAGRLNRLTVRMDNGTTQYIDTDSNEFPRGTRVELTADRMIRKAP